MEPLVQFRSLAELNPDLEFSLVQSEFRPKFGLNLTITMAVLTLFFSWNTTAEMISFTSPWSLLHLLLRWHFGTSSEGTLAEQLCLYYSLANFEESRPLASIVYKLLTQEKLQRQDMIMLDLVPMGKQRLDRSGPWLSTHKEGTDPLSVQLFNISWLANNLFSLRPDPIINNVYYAPESWDQVAFDSFIMADCQVLDRTWVHNVCQGFPVRCKIVSGSHSGFKGSCKEQETMVNGRVRGILGIESRSKQIQD